MYEKPSSKEEVNQVEEQDDNAILRSPSENDTEENSEDENNEPSTDGSNENELELNIVEEGSEENDETDRKSTRLNSSHVSISYAVFCLKKKNRNKVRQ